MQENRELKIAIIVGIIMVTICVVVIIFYNANKTTNNIDIKVYKVNEEIKKYQQCNIPSDLLVQINSEYRRAKKLSENYRIIGQKINGTYKIAYGDDYIAFDGENDKNYIYRGDTQHLYEFDSSIYSLIEEACK